MRLHILHIFTTLMKMFPQFAAQLSILISLQEITMNMETTALEIRVAPGKLQLSTYFKPTVFLAHFFFLFIPF